MCTVPDREGYNSYGDFMLGRCGLVDLCVWGGGVRCGFGGRGSGVGVVNATAGGVGLLGLGGGGRGGMTSTMMGCNEARGLPD